MPSFRVVLINLLFLLMGFVAVEIGFRLLHPDYLYYEQTYRDKFTRSTQIKAVDTNWVRPDPDLGWVCQPGPYLQFYDPTYKEVAYQINPQGFRNPISFDSIPKVKDRQRVLLLGDSFLFGIFLPDHQTIPQQLQQQLGEGIEVYNLAIPAWGLDQMYLAYQKYIDRIQPDEVILFYIDDDIARLAEAFYWGVGVKPVFRLENGELIERGGQEGRLHLLQSYFYFNSKLINSLYRQGCLQECLPVAHHIFEQMILQERAAGRQLQVIRFPRLQQIADQSSTVPFEPELFFDRSDVSFFDFTLHLLEKGKAEYEAYYIPGDGHPSAYGAEEVAEWIMEALP